MVSIDTVVQPDDTTRTLLLPFPVQVADQMSKRQAELVSESVTAKQKPVSNLSASEKLEEDNEAYDVAGI